MGNTGIGHTRWAIAEGYIPGESSGPFPQMESHETVCILNTSEMNANVKITIFFTDKEPAGPFKVTVPARRTTHLRFNNLKDPEPIPRDTDYASLTVENARLWSRPEKPPLLIAAALSPETAEWAAGWADGLITITKPREKLIEVVEGWHRGGGKKKPMFLQVKLSWADSDDEALGNAWKEWRFAVSESPVQTNLPTPEVMEVSAAFVKPEDMRQYVRISSRTSDHVEQLREDIEMGFDQLFLHNVGRNQMRFIQKFGEEVLPQLKGINRREIDRA